MIESLSCVWLLWLMDCSLPGSSVHGILNKWMNKDRSDLGYSFWKSRDPNPSPARIPRSRATEASSQGLKSINSFKSIGGQNGKLTWDWAGAWLSFVEGGYSGDAAYMSPWSSQLYWGWGLSVERTVTFAGHIFMVAQGKAGTTCIWAGKHKAPWTTDELLPAAFTDALYLFSRMSYIIDAASPAHPWTTAEGQSGLWGGEGRLMSPQNCQAGGLVLMFSNPSGLRGSGGNSLDFKAPGFDFGFIAAYSTPLVLNYLITTKGGNASIQDGGEDSMKQRTTP